jgi:hypothetical protein
MYFIHLEILALTAFGLRRDKQVAVTVKILDFLNV